MKFLTEYRNPDLVKFYLSEIEKTDTKPWNIMEICGGQTHSLVNNGKRSNSVFFWGYGKSSWKQKITASGESRWW